MKTTCASSLAFGREAFETLGEVEVLEGRSITHEDLTTTDLLAIRSTTKVPESLVADTPIRFVGTATIGIDHLDTTALDARNIAWAAAPGSNANSVAEYITAALLWLAVQNNWDLKTMTLGIIGVGNVGTAVAHKARALGMNLRLNDPPKARDLASKRLQPDALLPNFEPLEDVLSGSDIVTLHVPLTRKGPDATLQMANTTFFDRLRHGAVFINSARGPVMNTPALLAAMDRGQVSHAVIDTWENEPEISPELLDRADIGTPHIAGYSFDGKVRGTEMIYEAACAALGLTPTWDPATALPAPDVPEIKASVEGRHDDVLHDIVSSVYDITTDDARLREAVDSQPAAVGAAFDQLRGHYPIRREFHNTRITVRDAQAPLVNKIRGLGFKID